MSSRLFKNLILSFSVLFSLQQVSAQGSTGHYSEYLSEYGSTKPAFTIYTNPGQDCETSMNISWATPTGKKWMIELTDDETGESYLYDYDEELPEWRNSGMRAPNGKRYKYPYVYSCETFNEMPSKLRDNTSVTEMHVFDKHGYELFDLDPNTDYKYRIVTINDSTQKEEYSDYHHFRTAGAESWKAAVISDFHHYSPLWRRMDAAMGMLDVLENVSGGFDWILSPGDVVAHGGSYNYWTELSDQPYSKNYMWAVVQGNHDTMAANSRISDDFFRDTHYFPQNGYEGQEGLAYWFKYGDVLFIMLNNEAMKTESTLQPALEWMEKVVKDNPSKYIVVVQHYQWINGTDGKIMQLDRFYETFERLGVDLAISGNNHVYLRTPPLKEKMVTSPEEGIYYVVTPASDDARGRDISRRSQNLDIIEKRWSEGPKTVGGMIMDVNPQRIVMTLYDRYGDVQDTFTVPAKR